MFSESAKYPKTMQSLPNWVLWKLETVNGRLAKIPYSALYHGRASSTNPQTWTTFYNAERELKAHGGEYAGIGFVFSKDAGIVFVDIDHCIRDGVLDDRAEAILLELGDYAFIEKSQSGTGLHLFVKGSIPSCFNNHKHGVEMYDSGRFCAMTGDVYPDHGDEPSGNEIVDEALKRVYERYRNRSQETKKKSKARTGADAGGDARKNENDSDLNCSDEEIIEKAKSNTLYGKRFEKVFSGDFSDYSSQSEADAFLCRILAFWTGKDFDQTMRIIRNSGAYREKWDREDYQIRTFSCACNDLLDLEEWKEQKREEDLHAFESTQDPEFVTTLKETLEQLKPDTNPLYCGRDDASDGKLFADVFRGVARYNVSAKKWYVYNSIVWEEDTGGVIVARYAETLYRELWFYAVDKSEDYRKHVGKLGNLNNRKKMIEDASKHYFITHEMLDADPNLLNLRNGVLKLDSLELVPHDADLLLSKCANVFYEDLASSDDFLSFIEEIMRGDEEKIRYLQKIIGLGLTCNTSEEECYLLYGSTTRNGKSTLLETVGYMMGDYAMTINPETLACKKKDGRQASGDVARLNKCRFLRMSEPPKRMQFDIALLKTFLGRDTLTARHLFEREFEFVPVFTLYINTNYLPTVNDDTVFSSGRIKVITFDRHFEEDEQDKGLKERLKGDDNLSGILNWCLDGLRAYRRTGLTPPPCVLDATKQYRDSSDKLSLFIEDALTEDPEQTLSAKALYRIYSDWCRRNNYGEESKRSFMEDLKTHRMLSDTGTIGGRTVRNVVKGYRIVFDYEFSEPPEDVPFTD